MIFSTGGGTIDDVRRAHDTLATENDQVAVLQCTAGYPAEWEPYAGLEVSLDVSNILDTTAVMQQQIFGDSPGSPGAKPVKIDSGWTRNDRRYQLGIRFRY